MSNLTIFANFFIDTKERYLRMMDSFRSFYQVEPVNWVINIRGRFKEQAAQFLRENVKEELRITFMQSEEGWFYDTQKMLNDISTSYVFLWIEDQINIAPIEYLKSVLEDIEKSSIDMFYYSFFNNDNRFKGQKMLNTINIEYFLHDNASHAIMQKNYPGAYIITYASIIKSELFKKIITMPLRKVIWPKETPFNFEKDHEQTEWLPLVVGKPKKEIFVPIDDDRDLKKYSLQSRGLYPIREGRSSYAVENENHKLVKILGKFKKGIINRGKKAVKAGLKSFKNFLINVYRFVFARPKFYNFNKLLFDMALSGLGVLNCGAPKISGEYYFLKKYLKSISSHSVVIVDVGANEGDYSRLVKKILPTSNVYSFEPHPKTFLRLKAVGEKYGFVTINSGCGDICGTSKLFDMKGQDGSSLASLYKEVIENIHKQLTTEHLINITTLDDYFFSQSNIKINLLKIDTEGNELKVLLGAKKLLEKGLIDVIHFEFNEMNVFSRVYMKDFFDYLSNYQFYRMLPAGLVKIDSYIPLTCEIFAYQNIVAVNKNIRLSF